jgi:putative NADPH-quinone reductase
MPRRILIIQGHPDPEPARLCRALADAYAEGAAAAGHAVERLDLARLELPFLRSQAAFEHAPAPPGLQPAQAALRAAEHVVLIFPLWLGGMPAMVKAFLEQTMRPGTAFAYRPGRMPEKLMTGRSVRLVVTMGMPVLVFRWWYRGHGLKALTHGILAFVGFGPIRATLLGRVGEVGGATRQGWLARMRRLGAKAR